MRTCGSSELDANVLPPPGRNDRVPITFAAYSKQSETVVSFGRKFEEMNAAESILAAKEINWNMDKYEASMKREKLKSHASSL